MRTCTYTDGRPSWSDNEPSRARMTGWGGTFTQHAVPLVGPIAQPRPVGASVLMARSSDRARCAIPVRFSTEPCARNPGHRNQHASAASLAALNARRRTG